VLGTAQQHLQQQQQQQQQPPLAPKLSGSRAIETQPSPGSELLMRTQQQLLRCTHQAWSSSFTSSRVSPVMRVGIVGVSGGMSVQGVNTCK
jgi:hypothetical protein